MSKKQRIKAERSGWWKKILKGIQSENRESLEKDLFRFTAAYRIRKDISASLDLKNCIKLLVDRIADLLSVEIVSVMLMDKKQRELVLQLAKGFNTEITDEVRTKVGEGIAGWIAKTGEPLLIEDIKKDPRFKARGGRYYTDSLLSVPIKTENDIVGVINVNNKVSRDVFKKEDLEVLRTVAELTAAVITANKLRQEASALDNSRKDFVFDVSHELRTPLSSAKQAIALMLDKLAGNINEQQKKYLNIAKHNIDRLDRLIDGLLAIAKKESEALRMKRKLFDAKELVSQIADSLGLIAESKGITLVKTLPAGQIKIWADRDKLTEVLTNLISNGIKYNKSNGKVEVGLKATDKLAEISVKDTGIGMPETDLDRIFDRFYRVEMRAKGKAAGTGLGLSLVKDIVEKHGGRISVRSEPDRGTEFTVTLPKDLRGGKIR